MKCRNAQYNHLGTVDCEIEHPDFGWIPFTADPNDVEPHGREIFDALKDSADPNDVEPLGREIFDALKDSDTPYVTDDAAAPN